MSVSENMEKHFDRWGNDPELGKFYSDLKARIFFGIQDELVKEHGGVWCVGSQEYVFDESDRSFNLRIELAKQAGKITDTILDYCGGDAQKAYEHIDELYCLFRGAANE